MSEYIDRILRQVEEMMWEDIEPPAIPPDSEYAIDHDSFDTITWKGLNAGSKAVAKSTESFAEQFDAPGERAFEDLFNLFYKADPRLTGAGQMLPEFKANHQLLSEFVDSEEVKQLRAFTVLDDYYAGSAMLEMEQQLRDALERVTEAQEKVNQAQQDAQQAREDLQQAADEASAGGGGDGQDLQEKLDAAQAAKEALDAAQQEADNTAQSAGQDLRHGAEQAKKDQKEADAQCATYGYGPGDLQQMDFDERRELSKRLHSGKVKRLADLVGQWRLKARAMRRQRVKHEPGEVNDYELGQDLTRITSTERDALAVPELQEQFWLRFAKYELMLEIPHGTEKAGQGPIIVMCDESMSMDTALDVRGNTREAWSKALTLALVGQARKEKRDFTYIGFDSSIVFEGFYPKGKIGLRQLIEFVEHFGGGGTAFMPPLQRAFTLIQEAERAGRNKADIVFITDGDGALDAEFAQEFRDGLTRQGAACYAIQVGNDSDARKVATKLAMLTDKVMFIDRLNANPEGVSQLFRNI